MTEYYAIFGANSVAEFQDLQSGDITVPKAPVALPKSVWNIRRYQLLHLKAEIGGPSKEFDTTNCATTTFHKFNGLPVELRTMIWRLSFGKARIFRLCPISEDLDIIWLNFTVSHRAPASAQARRESRAVFQAEALQLFAQNTGHIFPDCKKILFVMRHHPLPDTDVRFTKVKEDDDMNIEYEEDLWQWRHIWPQLRRSWPTYGNRGPPEREAVDVVPVRD
ncbi:hypothetical protein FACUT_6652 [Fusarium acutatum]|uniref:2EXR domain-containing protein n=1 Tax=Fusarium acutatum TaxID=78861 RepID=A0A8H4NIF1_9HYPO|nr:hypothetical protein FACUT_6652 [Fusarium acutatum]